MKKFIIAIVLLVVVLVGLYIYTSKKEIVIENKPIEREPTIIMQEKLVLGYVEKMKTTCYTLVEFGSMGITANGYELQPEDGWLNKKGKMLVANNNLPFGTKIKIEGFGDTVFEVIDRIGWGTDLDIYWGDGISAYRDCLNWGGAKKLQVLILQNEDSVFTQ
jgi:3D (Asp-Asp-Asp) domain-containing protein